MIRLRDVMHRQDGWGRAQGREVYQNVLSKVESRPGIAVFCISFDGVVRLDTSFASESVVEIARRFRKERGFCIVDLSDEDIIENVDLAALKKEQPIYVWRDDKPRLLGPQPSAGVRDALAFALQRAQIRSAEYAESKGDLSAPNASMKFKALWENGYLLRRETTAESGGLEYVYSPIR